MSDASQTAAIAWRAERLALGNLAPCDRWYVHGGRSSPGQWTACPPCYCSGSHDEAREQRYSTFDTFAEAIAYATEQARAQTISSTPRRRPDKLRAPDLPRAGLFACDRSWRFDGTGRVIREGGEPS